MNFGDSQLDSRIWSKIIPEPNTSCWLWLAALNSKGYASIWDPELEVMTGAHRYIYEFLVGPVADGLELDHKCRVTCCVNPDHLERVTRSVNVLRGDTGKARGSVGHRNKQKTHCPKGHAYYPDNLYLDKKGWRRCKICHLAQSEKYRKRA